MPDENPKKRAVDYTAEVARIKTLPNMDGVASKLADAVEEESAIKEQLKIARKRLRKMYAGILTVLGENK